VRETAAPGGRWIGGKGGGKRYSNDAWRLLVGRSHRRRESSLGESASFIETMIRPWPPGRVVHWGRSRLPLSTPWDWPFVQATTANQRG
jgi:hypothetical protein